MGPKLASSRKMKLKNEPENAVYSDGDDRQQQSLSYEAILLFEECMSARMEQGILPETTLSDLFESVRNMWNERKVLENDNRNYDFETMICRLWNFSSDPAIRKNNRLPGERRWKEQTFNPDIPLLMFLNVGCGFEDGNPRYSQRCKYFANGSLTTKWQEEIEFLGKLHQKLLQLLKPESSVTGVKNHLDEEAKQLWTSTTKKIPEVIRCFSGIGKSANVNTLEWSTSRPEGTMLKSGYSLATTLVIKCIDEAEKVAYFAQGDTVIVKDENGAICFADVMNDVDFGNDSGVNDSIQRSVNREGSPIDADESQESQTPEKLVTAVEEILEKSVSAAKPQPEAGDEHAAYEEDAEEGATGTTESTEFEDAGFGEPLVSSTPNVSTSGETEETLKKGQPSGSGFSGLQCGDTKTRQLRQNTKGTSQPTHIKPKTPK